MNKFGTTMGFGNVLVSSFLLGFGLSIVISSKLSYGLAVIFILLSIMSFLFFISDKTSDLLLKMTSFIKKVYFLLFYICFGFILSLFIASWLLLSFSAVYLSMQYIYG